MPVSLVATILNEGHSIHRLLDSIAAQLRVPDEIIFCDGGSTDNTLEVLEAYTSILPVQVIVWEGANISQGRNAAIQAASHDLIAVTDAGVILDSDWLAGLIEPLESSPETNVVAGFFLPDSQTPFEVAMGATVLPTIEDIDPATFMPSSRSVAFRKDAWAAAGGYPEWLDFCEDLILDFRLQALSGPFAFAPQAVVYFRPRSSLAAFFTQYYQYARGDGKANLFFRRHLIRYLTYGLALPFLLVAVLLVSQLWLLGLVAGGVYMVWTPYRRLVTQWGGLTLRDKIAAALWVPIIRIAGDVAKMWGYPAGILWRIRNRPPDWRITSRHTRETAR